MMIFISVTMYTTSYIARDCESFSNNYCNIVLRPFALRFSYHNDDDYSTVADPRIQHEHAIQKEALNEYWAARGGAPDHH